MNGSVLAAQFVPLLLSGVTAGMLYSLIAAGLWVVWRLGGVANFAQSELAMVAAFTAYSLAARWGWPAGLAAALAVGAVCGLALGRLTALTAEQGSQQQMRALAVTFGCMHVLRGGASLVWGDQPVRWLGPWQTLLATASPFRLSWLAVGTAVLATSVVGLLAIWLRYSQTGLRLRAAVSNRALAALTGLQAGRLQQVAWLVGGLLAVPAGVAAALHGFLDPAFMADWMLPAFIVVLFVPTLRPWALLPAGLALGVGQQWLKRVALPGAVDVALFVLIATVVLVQARHDGEPR